MPMLKALYQQLVEKIVVDDRNHIYPTFRVPFAVPAVRIVDGLVEVSGLEPPTSTLRTSFLYPPEQGLSDRTSWYKRCFPLTLPQDPSPFRKIRSVKN
jgi:hypothetical protein